MKDKGAVIKHLLSQRTKYKKRGYWLGLLLVCEILIWAIVNPDYIPVLNEQRNAVKQFFLGLLWPHDFEDFLSGSYRVQIYRFCQWLQQQPVYDPLAAVVPKILPVCVLINLILIAVCPLRIKFAKTEKKKGRWKLKLFPNSQHSQKKFSGLFANVRDGRKANLRKLQESCTQLQPEQVLWVGNFAKGSKGKAPQDKLYPLIPNDVVRIQSIGGEYQFWLEETRPGTYEAVVCAFGQAPFRLVEGMPLVIAHKNDAGNEIREMTVTWIGGSV